MPVIKKKTRCLNQNENEQNGKHHITENKMQKVGDSLCRQFESHPVVFLSLILIRCQ